MDKITDVLLLKSKFVQNFDCISDECIELILKESELNKNDFIALLMGDATILQKDIVRLWQFLHKYDIERNILKEKIVKIIYSQFNYCLDIFELNTPLAELINRTCINLEDKCSTCRSAAEKGHLECLKYLRENGFSWDEGCDFCYNVCSYAAEKGHLDCLKYAHENGCPWDKETCESAVWVVI